MKYPQLVSPRAVNAISDWLVSRLEQLGVESPQIYTRLLLSLLQSSVQVNDPIEFSNLEAFFANRKGGHKRFHLPSDTETLKKLNAVQCLREIVSNEQEIATIEHLVEELCEKLKDIEKQTQNLSDEERFLIETHLNTDSLLQNQTHSQLPHQQQPTSSNNNNPTHNTRHHPQIIHNLYNNPHSSALHTDTKRHHHNHHHALGTITKSSDNLNDLDNDPKKRYFRAFPALSKEMEDSFRVWRRNAKSLTWPIVGRSIVADNIDNSSASLSSSSTSSIISSSNVGANSVLTDKIVEKKVKVVIGQQLLNKGVADISGSSEVQQQQGTAAAAAAANVKKKSKRRRNQALCKGKTIQNIRKLSVGSTSNSVGVNNYKHYTHHRNSSPAWDTDFKGCWEMGPDLIKEFLSRQNDKKRNRSNSDSMDHEDHNERKILNETPIKNEENPLLARYIDLSFCCNDEEDDEINENQQHFAEEGVDYVDEDYDDNTLNSLSELRMDNFNRKRLYQRAVYTQNLLNFDSNMLVGKMASDNSLDETTDFANQTDFQQFKAKFNSSVEALWKDGESMTTAISTQQPIAKTHSAENTWKLQNSLGSGGISSAFYATTSLNALAPFKNDLWNFWSNYQQQPYEQVNNALSTTASTSSMITITRFDDSSVSSGTCADIANSSDYFSMPSNLDDFDKSVGSVRRGNEGGISLGEHTPPINVFLQNSIWSTSKDCVDAIGTTSASTTADTDESFLFKVWHSNKKLIELDAGNAVTREKMHTTDPDSDGVSNNDFNTAKDSSSLILNNPNLGANLQFPLYQHLKWSEGINAGPAYGGSLRTPGNFSQHNDTQSFNNGCSLLADNNNFGSFSSASSIKSDTTTWKAPAYGQHAQPDLKSWCASNPISLTEMYGNDVCDSIVNHQEEKELNETEMEPTVTLSNHCAVTSGFIAYSRIKQYALVQPEIKSEESSSSELLPKDFFRNSAEENLLGSDRTHFYPIESFVDGHTFQINDALDTIEFERTSSGAMIYESEEYLEYTRVDEFIYDDDYPLHSPDLFKYENAEEDVDKCDEDVFVIKFRAKRSSEIACQTEEQYFELDGPKMCTAIGKALATPSLDVSNMFHSTFSLSRQANNEAIMAAVTKAVAAAAKAAAENHAGHFCWLPCSNANTTNAAVSDTGTDNNDPLWRQDNNSVCDEVDFSKIDSNAMEQQEWSLQEVETKCQQRNSLPQQQIQQRQQQQIKRVFPITADTEKSEENSLDSTSLRTLWGMCAVCDNCEDDKSMPADRLLRDELELEADEIMSDLRFMQDLYIDETFVLNEAAATTTTTKIENELAAAKDKSVFSYFIKELDLNSIKNPSNVNTTEQEVQKNDAVQVSMLQKMNQLIEDLLKQENATKLENDDKEILQNSTQMDTVWNLETEQNKAKNLWQFSEQKQENIWQHKPSLKQFEGEIREQSEMYSKPIELLKQVGGSLGMTAQYDETLNWEHDNLAKIWQHSIPTTTTTQLEGIFIKSKQNELQKDDDNESVNENLYNQQHEEGGVQMAVEEKNLKNFQNSNELTLTPTPTPTPTPSPLNLATNTYKRVQQFWNSSSAKMKLVANRKRRHSASQNFYYQQHLQSSNNNNNDDDITDLNIYKEKLNYTLKNAKEQPLEQAQAQQRPLSKFTAFNDGTFTGNLNTQEQQPTKQTIITCKYWTTATNGTQSSLDSATAAMMLLAAATSNANSSNTAITSPADDNYDQQEAIMLDENIFGNTFSCLIDKNASILKHVTMMARPLTR